MSETKMKLPEAENAIADALTRHQDNLKQAPEKLKKNWIKGLQLESTAKIGEDLPDTPENERAKEGVGTLREHQDRILEESRKIIGMEKAEDGVHRYKNTEVLGVVMEEGLEQDARMESRKEEARKTTEFKEREIQFSQEIDIMLKGSLAEYFDKQMRVFREKYEAIAAKKARHEAAEEKFEEIVRAALSMIASSKASNARMELERTIGNLDHRNHQAMSEKIRRIGEVKCGWFGDGDVKKAISFLSNHEKDLLEAEEAWRDYHSLGNVSELAKRDFFEVIGREIARPLIEKLTESRDSLTEIKKQKVTLSVEVGGSRTTLELEDGAIEEQSSFKKLMNIWMGEMGANLLEKELGITITRFDPETRQVIKTGEYKSVVEILDNIKLDGSQSTNFMQFVKSYLAGPLFDFNNALGYNEESFKKGMKDAK